MAKKRKSRSAKAASGTPVSEITQQPLADRMAERPVLSALAVFGMLMVIFFFETLLMGKVFISPDQQAPAALSHLLREGLFSEGIFPHWTPAIFAGMPSYASLIYTPFSYLPYLPFVLVNLVVTLPPLMAHILHYPLAGLGVFLFLRDRNIDYVPALFGGIAFMFTPYLVVMETAGHGSQLMTSAYMPLALWSMDRLLRDGSWRNWGLAALIMGLQFQRAHIQIIYYTWMLLGLFLLYRLGSEFRQREFKSAGRMFWRFSAILVLALSMAAMQLLPIYEYTPFSIRGAGAALSQTPNAAGVGLDYAMQWSFSPAEMLTFIMPGFFGFGGATYWGTMPFTEHPNYMGIIVLVLAAFALVLRRRDGLVQFLTITIILALLLSFGKHAAWYYQLFYDYMPFFNKFRVPVMILVLVQMCFAILAGLGLQAILNHIKEMKDKGGGREALARNLLIAAGVLIGVSLVITATRSSFAALFEGFYPVRYAPRIQAQINAQRFEMLFADWWLMAIWLSAALGLASLALRRSIRLTTFATGLLVLTLADLWYVDYEFNKPVSNARHQDLFRADEVVQALQADSTQFRLLPAANLFGEVRYAAHGIQSIGGYHPAKLRAYQDILDATAIDRDYATKYYQTVMRNGQRVLERLPEEKINPSQRIMHTNLINFLNVKYILTPYPIPEPELLLRRQIRQFQRNQPVDLLLYENTRALPRAFLVGKYEVSTDSRQTLQRFTSPDFRPAEQVIVDQEPGLELAPDVNASAEIETYGVSEIRIKTNAAQPQLLVLSDGHYPPGWHATVDGEPAPILRANHAFRAVPLAAGEHTVIFTYSSRAFQLGALLTLLATLLIGWMLYKGLAKPKEAAAE